jgi:uncharacterized membrane protein
MQHHERTILREMLIGTCLSVPIIGVVTAIEYHLVGTLHFLYFGVLLMSAMWAVALVCLCVATLFGAALELLKEADTDPP